MVQYGHEWEPNLPASVFPDVFVRNFFSVHFNWLNAPPVFDNTGDYVKAIIHTTAPQKIFLKTHPG